MRFSKETVPENLPSKSKKLNKLSSLSALEKLFLFGLFSFSLFLLELLGKEVGGIYGLALKGYGVTELFIGKGHLANAFDWICGILLLFLGNAFLEKKSKLSINMWLLSFLFLILIFTVMGRRATIVYICLSSLFLYHALYKPIRFKKLCCLMVLLFVFLNVVGKLRQSNYENIGEVLSASKMKVSNESETVTKKLSSLIGC